MEVESCTGCGQVRLTDDACHRCGSSTFAEQSTSKRLAIHERYGRLLSSRQAGSEHPLSEEQLAQDNKDLFGGKHEERATPGLC